MSETREQRRERLADLAQEIWPDHEISLTTRDDFDADDEISSVCVVADPAGDWRQVFMLDVPDIDLALDALEEALHALIRGRGVQHGS